MSQLDLSGCKKRKRGERVFKFKVFGERGYPAEFNGSFQENVKALLEYGKVENGVCGSMASWSFQLEIRRHPLLHLFLFVVEEPVELSLELRCKHCQYIGWGHHMICNKKYHFLLPANKSTTGSGEYCKSNVVELQGDGHYTLHGVFHSNGFGHLLCINGSETGSGLTGHQIMDLWDRLCSGLGARKVSLKDVAKKKNMDLRLLHSMAYGKPWFGHWDYIFGRGSYGLNQEMYQSAIKAIQNIPLNLIAHQLGYSTPQNEIQIILPRYQLLSGHALVTLGDLFHFMLELKFRIPKESNTIDSHYPRIMSDASCRWSPKRVEMAIHVVVEALKRSEFQWVSRQHVRDIARAYIGDTGLLDFVLKSLGNHIVGKYFVRRCLNPVTKVLEYCLEDVSRAFPKQEANFPMVEAKLKSHVKISWGQLMRDILYMYKNILSHEHNNVMMSTNNIGVASRIILDSKYLVKQYRGDLETCDESNKWKVYCAVVLTNNVEAVQELEVKTPYHCFVLRSNAIFDELRFEVEKAFREMYVGLRNFVAESIRNMNPIRGSDMVFKTVKPGGKIVFEFKQEGVNNGGIYDGVIMVVDCLCGAKDDDGERLVSCDICQVWQHTRCVEIPENDEIPNIFICCACEQDIMSFRSLP